MLEWVKIKNLALIAEAEIDFAAGFNVVTGETGAGKSVLLGTVALLLGERADKGVIRGGEERCEITAGISLPGYLPEDFYQLLDDAGIDMDRQEKSLELKRIITTQKTRNFINDTPVTLQTLKAAGDFLIDIHGANEHQSLLLQSTQLRLLDRFGHHEELIEKCSVTCAALRDLRRRRDELFSNLPSPREAEQLRAVIADIDKVAPQPDEDREIGERHRLAANSRQLLELSGAAIAMISETENSAVDHLAEVYRTLNELNRIDPEGTENFLRSCEQITEQLRDLTGELEHYAGKVDLDQEEFMRLEERLSELQRLKRRYGPSLDDVINARNEADERLQAFENSEKLRTQLDEQESQMVQELRRHAQELSQWRRKSASVLAADITAKLQTLGFLRCSLDIDFTSTEPGTNGMDKIDFIFAPNPGEPAQPLRNIASSGEISRVMLALKTVLAEADDIPILVFDEIDANIGGETAVTVGGELKKLARHRQILCISHLPQVAARGQTHFLVRKNVSEDRTSTSIVRLSEAEREKEIARMLGGGNAAMAHAREILQYRD